MKVFLAGCGTMGAGIAQTFAVSGYEVVMFDRTMELVDRGYAMIEKQLRKQEERGRMTAEEVDAALRRLSRSVDLNDASDATLVLEAIFEDMIAKRELLKALDRNDKEGGDGS
jgi:3-hydroxybutyryl-CoA dehydrogenase